MNDIKTIYNKMRNGDSISTPQLKLFVEHMDKLEELLIPLGTDFNIIRTHVIMQKRAAESFLFHRSLP